MASRRYEEKYGNERPVIVHHRKGCELCGRKGRHTHTQPDWREFIDQVGQRMGLG